MNEAAAYRALAAAVVSRSRMAFSALGSSTRSSIAPHHSLSPEYGLRPLFASLEGTPIDGVYATDDQLIDGRVTHRQDVTADLPGVGAQLRSGAGDAAWRA